MKCYISAYELDKRKKFAYFPIQMQTTIMLYVNLISINQPKCLKKINLNKRVDHKGQLKKLIKSKLGG